ASASCRAVGRGCSSSQRRTSARRGSSSGATSKSMHLHSHAMPGWNFADVWEVAAERLPDATALVHGDRRVTWAEFDRRADGVAKALLDAGVERQDKVAHYLYNGNEYLESLFGIEKASLVPVNTNYRYGDEE